MEKEYVKHKGDWWLRVTREDLSKRNDAWRIEFGMRMYIKVSNMLAKHDVVYVNPFKGIKFIDPGSCSSPTTSSDFPVPIERNFTPKNNRFWLEIHADLDSHDYDFTRRGYVRILPSLDKDICFGYGSITSDLSVDYLIIDPKQKGYNIRSKNKATYFTDSMGSMVALSYAKAIAEQRKGRFAGEKIVVMGSGNKNRL